MEKLSIFESLKEEELNSAQDSATNNINKDENKLNFSDIKVSPPENTSTDQSQTQDMGYMETAQDIGASGATGVGKGLTYVMDMPFYLGQALNAGKGVMVDLVGKTFGFNEQEIDQAKKQMLILSKGEAKFPGEAIRDKALTYEPKTTQGKYAEAIGEWAAPGAIFGKGYKAKKLFASTGAVSGAAKQGVEDLSGNEMIGTGVGLGLNLGLDMAALMRGNYSVIAKDLLPDSESIKFAKDTQKYAKKFGFDDLKTSEVTGSSAIKAVESNVGAYPAGAMVIDKHWNKRPQKLKTFINNWAKQEGLLKTNNLKTDTDLFSDLKVAAVKLSNRRSEAWEKAGGAEIINFNYDSQLTNNLAITFANAATEQPKAISNVIKGYIEKINKSQGNGQALHNVYKDLRDMSLSIKKGITSASDRLLADEYGRLAKEVEKVLGTNTNFAPAQKKYKEFTDVYVEPLTDLKLSVFKNINKTGWEKDPKVVAGLYRVLSSNNIQAKDIQRFAESWKKSGDTKVWKNLTSNFFQSKFNDALADPKGANVGIKLYNSIMATPRQKENFTEMLFQLAKYENPRVKKESISNAVTSFGNVLKATGEKVASGSQTAGRLDFKEKAGKGFITELLKFPPGLKAIDNYLTEREFSKVSKELAEAMTSVDGITALEKLAQNWKDKNAAVGYLRAITIGSSEL